MLVDRVYKPKYEETSLEISPTRRQQDIFFCTTVNFEIECFLNEGTEDVLTDTLMNFHDWHLTWLSQLKPNVNLRTAGGLSHLRTVEGGGYLPPPPPPENSKTTKDSDKR